MTKEELKNYVDSIKEKLQKLEEKAFEENKGLYPIIKTQIDLYTEDVVFVENQLRHDLDEGSLKTYQLLLDQVNITTDLDFEKLVRESSLETPFKEAICTIKSEANLGKAEAPTQEAVAAPTEETKTQEETKDIDSVNTEEILNTLENKQPEVEAVPKELVDEMLAAANGTAEEEVAAPSEPAPAFEASTEETVAAPTQDVKLDAIDSLLSSLSVAEPTEAVTATAGTVVEGTAGTSTAVAGSPEEQPMPETVAPGLETPPSINAFAQQPAEAPVAEGPTLELTL